MNLISVTDKGEEKNSLSFFFSLMRGKMSEEDLKRWWMKKGAFRLNAALVNWAGLKTGYVPLRNFLSEFCNLSAEDEEKLIPLLVSDGAAVRVRRARSGRPMVYIWLK